MRRYAALLTRAIHMVSLFLVGIALFAKRGLALDVVTVPR
jgi:hypothetical protein